MIDWSNALGSTGCLIEPLIVSSSIDHFIASRLIRLMCEEQLINIFMIDQINA
jgi:hypothetical protein